MKIEISLLWSCMLVSIFANANNNPTPTLAVTNSSPLHSDNFGKTSPENSLAFPAASMQLGWNSLGTGLNGTVYAMVKDAVGNIYVGGSFTTAGGISANRVAKWDGSTWSALGSGVNGQVAALALDDNGNLYVGGYFSTAGGISANRIAKWDGSTWSALSSGMSGTGSSIRAIAIDDNGTVYAGGFFTNAGGAAIFGIAKWNGATWSSLGSIPQFGIVNSIVIQEGTQHVYIAGDFTSMGSLDAHHVAKWNGTTWSTLGSGMSGDTRALVFGTDGTLYATGYFGVAGGQVVNRIAKWNGSAWSSLNNGFQGYQGLSLDGRALAVDEVGNIYVGGTFTTAFGVTVNRIAKWDGTNWSNITTGLNGPAYTVVAKDDGDVYVGGDFTVAGGYAANRVAFYETPSFISLPDVGISNLVSPENCGNSATPVSIEITNYGNTQFDFSSTPLIVTANFTGIINTTLFDTITTGTLAPGSTMVFTMSSSLNTYQDGNLFVNISISIPGDMYAVNNDIIRALSVFPSFMPPYSQSFDASNSLPTGWANIISSWSASNTHGLSGRGLYSNVKADPDTAQIRTPAFGPLVGTENLAFQARVLNFTNYPNGGAPPYFWGSLSVSISSDCGGTFQTVQTWTDLNGSTWKNKEVNLAAYAGQKIVVRFDAVRTAGNWFIDIDNVRIDSPTGTYYPDNDGDGFGASNQGLYSLFPIPAGYITDGSDCNDNNPNINPNQTEICANLFDDNCDGDFALGNFEPVLERHCTDPNLNKVTISNILGGVPPFEYSKDGGLTFGTNPVFTNLSPGTYSFTVKDNTNCWVTHSLLIKPLMSLSTSQTDITCNGLSNGIASVSVSNGYAPFSYLWRKGTTVIGNNAPNVNNLGPGNYSVSVTDSYGCTAVSATITMVNPPVLTLSLTKTNLSCYGAGDGSVISNVGGGVPPYSFSWNSGPNTQNRYNLSAGTYKVTVTDSKQCTKNALAALTQPPKMTLTLTRTNVVCNGEATGIIAATATGGTGPKTFLWSNGATSSPIINLTAGAYTVTVTDGIGCTKTGSATITQPSAISLKITQVNPSCFGDNNGSVSVVATGGTGNKTYLWNTGSTNPALSGLYAGTYTITVTDDANCQKSTTVVMPNPPLLQIDSITTVPSTSSGKFNATVWASGGTGAKKYRRSTTGGFTGLSSSNVFLNLVPDTYTFIVQDSKLCMDTAVQVVPALLVKPGATAPTENARDFAAIHATDFMLQPNPAQQSVRLIFSDGQIPTDGQLDITDASGRLLRQIMLGTVAANNGLVSLENLPTGVTMVVLRANGQPPVCTRLVILE